MTVSEELGVWYDRIARYLDFNKFIPSLNSIYKSKDIIYPIPSNVFRVFKELRPDEVRVVILGQDPYHDGSAIGRAFAVENNSKIPFSLQAIIAERDRSIINDISGYDYTLSNWVNQGIFLLNTALTVKKDTPGSHMHIWDPFTKAVIKVLNETPSTIFCLWGNNAKSYESLLTNNQHILKASHPAAEAYTKRAGFYYCNHFVKINDIIKNANGNNFIIKW